MKQRKVSKHFKVTKTLQRNVYILVFGGWFLIVVALITDKYFYYP